jgi:cytochrome c556
VRRSNRLAWVPIVLIGAVLPCSSFADEQDVRDYRSHVMKSMGEEVAALNQIAAGKAAAADVTAHAEVLRITAGLAKAAFTEKVAGGQSKPEVWSKWDDFSKRLDDMVASTTDLANSAKQGGVAAVTPKLNASACKACHDEYMVQKK